MWCYNRSGMRGYFLFSLVVTASAFQYPSLSGSASFTTPGDRIGRYREQPWSVKRGKSRTGPCWTCAPNTSDSPKSAPELAGKDVAFYVHIPWCRKRCRYCDFAIVPIGPVDTSEKEESIVSSYVERQNKGFRSMDEKYLDSVLTEIEVIRRTTKNNRRLLSIYFGGGTPSLAPVSSIKSILDAILDVSDSPFYLANDAEVTIEMDPGTFDLAKLESLKEMGFNRISLGVQSFDNVILEAIGRVHRRADVMESIDMIKEVFGDRANYSIDLISGLPGLNLGKWVETLQTALSLSPFPTHVSLYDLQVEQGTVFGRWYGDSAVQNPPGAALLPLPSADDCAFMYKYASGYLRSRGYEHYEISSYAYVGQGAASRSRHNQIYWEIGSDWYAVGLGATSSVEGKRFARPRLMTDYASWAEELRGKVVPPWLPDSLSTDFNTKGCSDDIDFLCETIMTRLRTADGLNLDWIRRTFYEGERKASAVLQGVDLALSLNMAHMVEGNDGNHYLRLSDPVGFLFSNSIISSIFVELEGI